MSLPVKPKPKTCRVCGKKYQPEPGLRPRVCGVPCAVKWSQRQREATRQRLAREQKREARRRLMTRSDYLKTAQAAFNAWIRERDKHLPCVSCGRWHEGQWHAGHYRTTAAAPELRFEPLNVWRQCAPCNNHKSGDIVNYRKTLLERIGPYKLEWLEGPHEAKHYTVEQLQEIAREYRAKTRELKKQ